MSRKVRKYTREYKAEAIKLALSSDSVTNTAKELGMPEATLHTWVKKSRKQGEQNYELPSGEKGSVNVSDILAENRELRKRLARAELEKEILKKAVTYFAKESE
jgi:transposase